mmetsp:Transcript_39976/g.115604  ORF Transcript_39976/g.115604 Transcript_39976/m.115604 type:complete len:215 (-) Transcript_39976:90-734(-)
MATSVKFHGVPRDYSTADIAAEVDAYMQEQLGLASGALAHTYNFVHVPLSQSPTKNVGVAVVNFVDAAAALAAFTAMEGRPWRRGFGKIKCKAAYIQGLGPNLLHLAAAALTHERKVFNAPLVYDGPRPIDFVTALARLSSPVPPALPTPADHTPPLPINLLVRKAAGPPGDYTGHPGHGALTLPQCSAEEDTAVGIATQRHPLMGPERVVMSF